MLQWSNIAATRQSFHTTLDRQVSPNGLTHYANADESNGVEI